MPESCTQASLLTFGNFISQKLTGIIQALIRALDIKVYIIPPDVSFQLAFVKSQLAMEP